MNDEVSSLGPPKILYSFISYYPNLKRRHIFTCRFPGVYQSNNSEFSDFCLIKQNRKTSFGMVARSRTEDTCAYSLHSFLFLLLNVQLIYFALRENLCNGWYTRCWWLLPAATNKMSFIYICCLSLFSSNKTRDETRPLIPYDLRLLWTGLQDLQAWTKF